MACFLDWRASQRRKQLTSWLTSTALASLLGWLSGCSLNPRGELPGADENGADPQSAEGEFLPDFDDPFDDGSGVAGNVDDESSFPDEADPGFVDEVEESGGAFPEGVDDPQVEMQDPLVTDSTPDLVEPEPETADDPRDFDADAGVGQPFDGGALPQDETDAGTDDAGTGSNLDGGAADGGSPAPGVESDAGR